MKKRIFPLLLALILCLGLLPAAALAAGNSFVSGGGDVVNLGEDLSIQEGESYGFTVTPHSLDFGSCFVGEKVEPQYVTLTNTGDTNIDDIFSGFFVDHDERYHNEIVKWVLVEGELNTYEELEPGKSLTYEVRLNPWKEGSGTISYEGQFLLNSGVSYGYDVNDGSFGVGKTGRYGKIPGVLTVDYDIRPLSQVSSGDIDWDVEVSSIDFGVSDVPYHVPYYDSISKTYINILNEHSGQKKTFTVTNRGSYPFRLEAEVDNSKCQWNDWGFGARIDYSSPLDYDLKPGQSATVTVSVGTGQKTPGTVKDCVLKLTAYYPDSKEKNTITAEIPLSIKYLYDGGYLIRNVGNSSDGTVKTSDGIDRTTYGQYSDFIAEEGSSVTFVMTPNENYHLSDIEINGKSVGLSGMVGNTYTISDIRDSYDFKAVFAYGPAPSEPQPVVGNPQPASWAKADVDRAVAEGILPTELQSAYDQPITRREFCVLADALYTKVKGGMASVDASITFTDTADPAVLRMASAKVVNGTGGGAFAPDSQLTRQEAATMLARLAAVLGKPLAAGEPTFDDNDAIAGWARPFVGQMQQSGVMGGTGNNMFSPWLTYTREQSVITIMRLCAMTK